MKLFANTYLAMRVTSLMSWIPMRRRMGWIVGRS